jgi:hypothetical protein
MAAAGHKVSVTIAVVAELLLPRLRGMTETTTLVYSQKINSSAMISIWLPDNPVVIVK